MPPKVETYTFNQLKEIIEKNEDTMMKFFNVTVEKLEKKIDKLQEENILLKKEMGELKSSMEFQSEQFEENKKSLSEALEIVHDNDKTVNALDLLKIQNSKLEEKIATQEDRDKKE